MPNLLYYGDNLDVLRRYIGAETVDLVYLDPPFKSNQDYNVLFAEKTGKRSAAQIRAFEDTWHWDESAELAYQEIVEAGGRVSEAMQAFRTFLGENDMMAYLAMMAPRLVELRRVLKPTGSIYLHCDPTASHYLKMLMDGIFGAAGFKNDITWKRTSTKNDYKQGATNWARVHDVLLYYRKNDQSAGVFTQQFQPYDSAYVAEKYPHSDPDGRRYGLWDLTAPGSGMRGHPQYELMGVTRYWRYNKEKMHGLVLSGRVVQPRPGAVPRYKRYLDEMPGIAVGDTWDDIPPINSQAQERLGYPTQKPEPLLERILKTSSCEGDVVLDPFCGCGTTISVAQRLNRQWIGIDITHLAIGLMKHRLQSAFGAAAAFKVIGEPTDLAGATQLAEDDKFQFQFWALGLVGARPDVEKKGADKGIDGRIYFHDEGAAGKTKQIIISVKGGKTSSPHIRDLIGVLDREKAQIGVLITLQEPTRDMKTEAVSAGFYESPWGKHPRCQILTIAQLLEGAKIDAPPIGRYAGDATLKAAPKAKAKGPENAELFGDAPAPRKRGKKA